MARGFLSDFLLPLVKGGLLHIGRPIGPRALERIIPSLRAADASQDAGDDRPARAEAERRAALELRRCRRAQAAELVGAPADPILDETAIRLGAAVHDLLALGHPAFGDRGGEPRRERIARAALALAEVGAPASAGEAVNRHSLLARLPEIARSDRTVHFWIGRRTFIGRVPPRRMTALPRLRSVRVELTRRGWLREIGIPSAGRAAFLALNIASPLGEALDPLRLDPPLSWSRILPALRFAELCRPVAGRALEIGVKRAGDAFAEALFRFASMQEPPGGVAATPEGIRFAIGFLAHLVWLDVLFPAPPAAANDAAAGEAGADAGLDLAAMVAASSQVRGDLIWPRDVARDSDLGRAFALRIAAMAGEVVQRRPERLDAAIEIAQLAKLGFPAQAPAPAV